MPAPRHRWTPDGRCLRCALIRRVCGPDERNADGTRRFHEYRIPPGAWVPFAGPCAPAAQLDLGLLPPPSPAALAAAADAERAAETADFARRHALPAAVLADETVREALRVFRDATAVYVPAWATQGRS